MLTLKKASIDIDQDGINEYVIQSPDYEHIILRCYHNKVYSYRLDGCDYYKLNTDGTFYWCVFLEEPARMCGLNKIVFDGDTLNIKSIYSQPSSPYLWFPIHTKALTSICGLLMSARAPGTNLQGVTRDG